MALSGARRDDDWIRGDGLFMQIARQGLAFDTLTERAADGVLRGELATAWQSQQDGRVWHFDLREDVTFHDGAPFTARDVVASLTHLPGARVEATTTHAVRITLDQPSSALPLLLAEPAFIIRPAHAPATGIGTGLYRIRHFTPGRQVLSTRVENHYKDGRAGWFDEVELTSIPSEEVRGEALGAYLVDAVDTRDADALRALPDVVLSPDDRLVMQAVSRGVGQPSKVSRLRPLDDLRAAERWWFV
jgi:ABC-type transport system substrate-binding protein